MRLCGASLCVFVCVRVCDPCAAAVCVSRACKALHTGRRKAAGHTHTESGTFTVSTHTHGEVLPEINYNYTCLHCCRYSARHWTAPPRLCTSSQPRARHCQGSGHTDVRRSAGLFPRLPRSDLAQQVTAPTWRRAARAWQKQMFFVFSFCV